MYFNKLSILIVTVLIITVTFWDRSSDYLTFIVESVEANHRWLETEGISSRSNRNPEWKVCTLFYVFVLKYNQLFRCHPVGIYLMSYTSQHSILCYVLLLLICHWHKVKYTWICIARLRANASNALRYGSHSVTCKQHHICLYSQSQSITALWPVLIAPTHGGMARLSWPGWLVRLR